MQSPFKLALFNLINMSRLSPFLQAELCPYVIKCHWFFWLKFRDYQINVICTQSCLQDFDDCLELCDSNANCEGQWLANWAFLLLLFYVVGKYYTSTQSLPLRNWVKLNLSSVKRRYKFSQNESMTFHSLLDLTKKTSVIKTHFAVQIHVHVVQSVLKVVQTVAPARFVNVTASLNKMSIISFAKRPRTKIIVTVS